MRRLAATPTERRPSLATALLVACVSSAAALGGGCGTRARPSVMANADRTGRAPQATEASRRAPEAFAHAEKLRADAERAYEAGDPAGAQILSERAIAAYDHVQVLARVAIANERVARAKVALEESEKKTAETDGEQKRVAAQTADLDARLKAQKDAEALAAIGKGPANAARERARVALARSLAMDARMFCGAAQMLGVKPESLGEARKLTDEVTAKLAGDARPGLLEQAARARSSCLTVLATTRRNKDASSSVGRADELLAQVSAMGGLSPSRDERGVVVTLRDSLEKGALRPEAQQSVLALAKVALAHPDFPMQVVVHGAVPAPQDEQEIARERAEADAVVKILLEGGIAPTRIQSDVAAGTQPLAFGGKTGAQRNQRVEITFVDPGG